MSTYGMRRATYKPVHSRAYLITRAIVRAIFWSAVGLLGAFAFWLTIVITWAVFGD